MKITPKRAEPLSDREAETLRGVAGNTDIVKPLYKRLQKLGLIEFKNGVFVLTPQGHIHMMFRDAR
jgi:hypothetical protein